jgi:hypothetical protein
MSFRRLKVSERDVLLPFAVMFSCNLLLLILWNILDPLYWDRITVTETETYGTCNASGDSAWKAILIVLGLVNGLALVMANVEAYKARAITTEYGESKYIAIIMASILQVIIVGLPLLFLVDDNPTASYFIRSSIIFVICMSILLMMFVPKIYSWFKKTEARKMTSARNGGLRFQVYDSPELIAERAKKLDEYVAKVTALEKVMIERGYEAKDLFQEVGLTEMTTVAPSRYQSFARLSSESRGDAVSSTNVASDNEQPKRSVHFDKTSETMASSLYVTTTTEEKDEGSGSLRSLNTDNKTAEETVMSDTEAGPDLERNYASPSLPQPDISTEGVAATESPSSLTEGVDVLPEEKEERSQHTEAGPDM